MKITNLFSDKWKQIPWILFLVAGILITGTNSGCKEEAIAPEDRTTLSIRSGDHLELLGISCIPDSIYEICDSIPTIDSMIISLSDYPGCSFNITFEYYECGDSNYAYIYLGNYSVISHNCSAFSFAFSTAFTLGGAALAAFVENFDHDVYLKIKTILANSLIPHGAYPCDRGHLTLLSYIRVSCFKWCYVESGQTSNGKQIACGSDCCAERTEACRDGGGMLVITTAYDNNYPPHCAGPIIYSTGTPPGRCTSETDCDFDCPE